MAASELQPPTLAHEVAHDVAHDDSWLDALGAQSLAVTFVAEVLAEEAGGRWDVRAGRHHYSAERAVSCLVSPQAGDQVACWRVAKGNADTVFVVAVLARPHADTPCRVCIGSGVELGAHDGALTVRAARSIQLETPGFELQTEQAELRAGKVSLVYRSLQSIGEIASATIGQIRLVGSMLSTVFDSQVHHARQHQRTVDGVDRLEAQVIQQHASSLLHLQGENLLANGERVIKMQSAQIHLG